MNPHSITVPAPCSATSEEPSCVEASPHEIVDDLRRAVRRLSTERATLVARLSTMPKGTENYNLLLSESAGLVTQIEEIYKTLREIGPLAPRKATLQGIPTPTPPKKT